MHRVLAFLVAALPLLLCGCHSLVLEGRRPQGKELLTPHYAIVTDVAPEAASRLALAAEEMRAVLERVLPAPRNSRREARRTILAFRDLKEFRSFLRGHLFAQDRAVGFYCDEGEECAVVWHDPPRAEDVRVLRHELTHQHLAARLLGRLPSWLEEGLAEYFSLYGTAGEDPPWDPGGPAVAGFGTSWDTYRTRRLSADAIFAALEVHAGRRSWPDRTDDPADAVPVPLWAGGEGGYVMHLLFVSFLGAIGEGLASGALGRLVDESRGGEEPELDLSHRFRSVGELEMAFHDFVAGVGLHALVIEAESGNPAERARALERLGALGSERLATPPAGKPREGVPAYLPAPGAGSHP